MISGLHHYALEVPDLTNAWDVPPHLWGAPPPETFLANQEPDRHH